ncbi:MAG TPA: DUF6766 family protein [Solirubrobacterales bacterium]|nr:DUF6766 family protein [Solirubrobacterales bacterium]
MLDHGGEAISLGRYLTSSDFGQAVMENWQSEYLQFLVFLMLTIWLLQRGSPESKKLDQAGRESDEEQMIGEHAKSDSPQPAKEGGWRAGLYGNSLVIVMGTIFLLTWLAQSQSEFLAVGSFAVFAIYLRQRGSPESKPIGASHTDTGVES